MERLLQLSLHNTIAELTEAQRTAQYERLSKTKAERNILEKLGIGYHMFSSEPKWTSQIVLGNTIKVPNMQPVYHKRQKREEGTMEIQTKFGKSKDAVFVDASRNKHKRGFTAVVVDHENNGKTFVTPRTTKTETAGEIAIALAVSQTEADVTVNGSQEAVRKFANSRVSPKALRILMAGKKSKCSFTVKTRSHLDLAWTQQ